MSVRLRAALTLVPSYARSKACWEMRRHVVWALAEAKWDLAEVHHLTMKRKSRAPSQASSKRMAPASVIAEGDLYLLSPSRWPISVSQPATLLTLLQAQASDEACSMQSEQEHADWILIFTRARNYSGNSPDLRAKLGYLVRERHRRPEISENIPNKFYNDGSSDILNGHHDVAAFLIFMLHAAYSLVCRAKRS